MGIFRTKKYMDVKNVRLFYDEKSDQIRLTCTDPRIEGGLNLLLNSGRQNEVATRNALLAAGVIAEEEYQAPLPSSVKTPQESTEDPFRFPIGQGTKGTIYWEIAQNSPPQLVIAGAPGSGKTVLEHNLIDHAYKHAKHWDVYVAAPRSWTMNETGYIAHKLFDAADTVYAMDELLLKIKDRVMDRKDISTGKRQLIFIEEYDYLLEIATQEIYPERQRQTAQRVLGTIERLTRAGRYLGIHLVIETHCYANSLERLTPLSPTIVLLGRIDKREGFAVFGVDVSGRSFEHRSGRGMIRQGAALESVQVFSPTEGVPWY